MARYNAKQESLPPLQEQKKEDLFIIFLPPDSLKRLSINLRKFISIWIEDVSIFFIKRVYYKFFNQIICVLNYS